MSHPSYNANSPEQQARGEIAARRQTLDRAQAHLRSVERAEVGPRHCGRALWERQRAEAIRAVDVASQRLRDCE